MEPLNPPVLALRLVEALARDQKVVEAVGVELEELEVVAEAKSLEDAANPTACFKITDVVDSGAEAVAAEVEAVGPPAGQVVLLEDEYPLAGPRQGDGSREAARSRSNDDGVPIHSMLFSGSTPNVAQALQL